MTIRPAAVAGTWYAGTAAALASHVDRYLAAADTDGANLSGDLAALIVPHAGLKYSGPVAAHAYRLLRSRSFEVAVLVGPSHFVGFEGVALFPSGAFETPFGLTPVDEECGRAIAAASPLIRPNISAHQREHSLEMQLPFLAHLAPSLPVVPLLMGDQTASTSAALADALAAALRGRNALLIASTDLSHYHNASTAAALDRVVIDLVAGLDASGLQKTLDDRPEHACGGGPLVAVMRAATAGGARGARILNYGDSGDVSGDKASVVGYLAAALGTFDDEEGSLPAASGVP